MHHLVERPSENSYGRPSITVLFPIIQIMQILATLVREFLSLSARA